MITEQDRAMMALATANAKAYLKKGDRFRATRCPGNKRWATFERFDGNWIVSKSGIDDFSARSIDRVNDKAIDFTQPHPHTPKQ